MRFKIQGKIVKIQKFDSSDAQRPKTKLPRVRKSNCRRNQNILLPKKDISKVVRNQDPPKRNRTIQRMDQID